MDPDPARPGLNPLMLVLGALLLAALLFWMFLCTQPADNRVGRQDFPGAEQTE